MAEQQPPSPTEQVARLYEQVETQAEEASERIVGSRGFASVLGQLAENAAALSRLGSDAMDLVLRNLRLAGRRDVARLARQLARTEDKLERVLQELEDVRDQLERGTPASGASRRQARRSNSSSRRSGSSNGSSGKARKTAS